MGDVNIHVIGAVDEIWREEIEGRGQKIESQHEKVEVKRSFFALTAEKEGTLLSLSFSARKNVGGHRHTEERKQSTHTL